MGNHSINRVMGLYLFIVLNLILFGAINYYLFDVMSTTAGDMANQWASVALLFISVVLVSSAIIYDVFSSLKSENTGIVFRAKKLSDNYYLIQKRHSLVPFWSSHNEIFTSQLHAEERCRDLSANSSRNQAGH